jgi:osmotically-inducible protein OsmY
MLATIAFADDTLVFAGNSASLVADLAGDAETARCVQSRLCRSGYAALRANVNCDCRNGVLTLVGNLPSFFLAQVAQSVALHAPGVEHVVNRIRVP